MDTATNTNGRVTPWNKGKLLGQKPPLKLKESWAIRIRLQLDHRARELALFNLAIDSKLRGCDLVGLRVHDVVQGSRVAARAIVMQKKTQRPVQFEITEQTRDAVAGWISTAHLKSEQFLFQAVCRSRRTFRRDSIRGSSGRGSSQSGWTRRPTVPIPCDVRNRH
jgi:integrase